MKEDDFTFERLIIDNSNEDYIKRLLSYDDEKQKDIIYAISFFLDDIFAIYRTYRPKKHEDLNDELPVADIDLLKSTRELLWGIQYIKKYTPFKLKLEN